MKSIKNPKVMYSLLGILVVIVSIIVGVAIGANMSDGTERLSGNEQIVVKKELATYIESSTTNTEKIGSFGTLKYHVDSVKERSFLLRVHSLPVRLSTGCLSLNGQYSALLVVTATGLAAYDSRTKV